MESQEKNKFSIKQEKMTHNSQVRESQFQALNQPNTGVTSSEFAAKYSDKQEVYRFLGTECGIYLDHYEVMTIWHLRDIAAGKRSKILCKDAKQVHVPQFKELKVEKMLEFARGYPAVHMALPDC